LYVPTLVGGAVARGDARVDPRVNLSLNVGVTAGADRHALGKFVRPLEPPQMRLRVRDAFSFEGFVGNEALRHLEISGSRGISQRQNKAEQNPNVSIETCPVRALAPVSLLSSGVMPNQGLTYRLGTRLTGTLRKINRARMQFHYITRSRLNDLT
jgi:hypothetical protein